ncbi:MAG: flavin reductase family protein [Betaproteobacteria bacterium]
MNAAILPISHSPIDPTQLRRALGAFVTGVTVVTTRSPDGNPVGITVNSFNAVSLSPPLILWSLSLRAASFDTFERSSHFAVNVLGAHQISLSERFATSGGNKFAGVSWRNSVADMPLLEGTAASFVCRHFNRFPGGDHLILLGEVITFDEGGRAPLVYANGGYSALSDIATAARPRAISRTMASSG